MSIPVSNADPIVADSRATGLSRFRILLLGFVVATTVFYLTFLVLYLFALEQVVSLLGSLDLVETERLAAKTDNILFGMTFIYLVWMILVGYAIVFERRTDRSILFRLATGLAMEPGDSKRMIVAFRRLTLVGFLVVPWFFLHARLGWKWLFLEDGPVEYLTATGFAVAGAMLITTGIKSLRQRGRAADSGFDWAGSALIGIGLMCLLVCLEEISWGQRIFGWQTFDALATVNTQNELNIHNLFTDYFNESYFVAGCLFFVFNLWAVWMRVECRDRSWSRLLPHPGLLVLAALVTSFSFHLESNELVEPIAMLYMLGYSIQIAHELKNQARPSTTTQAARDTGSTSGEN